MSFRAVVIGLLGALLIAGAGYLHDQSATGDDWTSITAGHLLPISVLGSLILFVLFINPLISVVRRSWGFRPAELGVIVALMLGACSIPSRGLMQTFTPSLALPVYYNRVRPGWRMNELLSYAPPKMLANEGLDDPVVIDGFLGGLGTQDRHIGLGDVPWNAWRGPLGTFGPMLILMAVCVTSLALIVHRQWVHHERLRYPIADVTGDLIAREPGKRIGSIFHNRLFWWGLGFIFAIRLINGLHEWFPEAMIKIPLQWKFGQVMDKWPVLAKSVWSRRLFVPSLYPAVIAFTYFLASDVSMSLALAHVIISPIVIILILYGVDMSNDYMSGGAEGWQRFGSYLAFTLMLIYIGRRYYWEVIKRALAFGRGEGVPSYAAWACRILIVATAGLIVLMTHAGLDWPLAILTTLMMLMMFLGVSRISAETGLFFIHPRWQPLGVLLGLLGFYALGPKAIIVVGLLCVVLSLDPSQSLMPYFVNALRVCEKVGVKPARVGLATIGTYGLALVLVIVVALWVNYDKGVRRESWATVRAPTMPFDPAGQAVTKLKLSGQLAESVGFSPLERFANIRTDRRFIWFAGAGFVLVLVVSWLRLRYSWWPLHPVIFLVWATWPMVYFAHSFMLGWVIKGAVTRLGGHRTYGKLRAMMVGVIAGDLLGGIVFMIVGVVYYAVTGLPPKSYHILPQ